jgi:opacity protein-like surface antigen
LYAPNYKYEGDIFEAGLSQKGATYSENVTNLSAFISETLVLKQWRVTHPFLGILVGYGHNKTEYQRHNESGVLSPVLFNNETKQNIVYGAKIGVNFSINQHIELGVAYQYMSLGDAALGAGIVNPQGVGEIKPLISQAVLANFTYTV